MKYDWPPYSNRNISRWWASEHDELIVRLIDKWQWDWYWEVAEAIGTMNLNEEITSFLATDNSYNKVMRYAITRAKNLGLDERIREPEWKVCPLCGEKFIESSLPHPLIKRFGIGGLNFCSPCLKEAVLAPGDHTASKEKVTTYIANLTHVLQQIPYQDFGRGIGDFCHMDFNRRLTALRLLQQKPSIRRVKELFGSWLKALIDSGVLDEDARRTSRGIQCLANDGHVCLSLGEKTVDDYLHANGIWHEKEPAYPEANYRADFAVNGALIEHIGLKGNREYDEKTKKKQQICKAHDIDLILISPEDLAGAEKLRKKLNKLVPVSGHRDETFAKAERKTRHQQGDMF